MMTVYRKFHAERMTMKSSNPSDWLKFLPIAYKILEFLEWLFTSIKKDPPKFTP